MYILIGIWLLLSWTALAQEPPPPSQLEPVPDGPVGIQPDQDDLWQPEVTIIRRDDEIIEEYRIDGRLYMVKIIPRKGPPYFLIDTDGDGTLDVRRHDLDPNLMVPNWVIMRF